MFVEEFCEFVDALGGIVFVSLENVHEQAGVEIAGASAHDDAAGGSEAHRRIDGETVENSGDAGAVAEVGDDEARWNIFLESVENRFARQAVETIATNTGLPEFFGKREARGGLGKRAVESGVKARELLCVCEEAL